MVFDTLESSEQDGEPVEIYDFVMGNDEYRWTNSEKEMVILTETYTPLSISRTNVVSDSEENRQPITVTMPAASEPAVKFISGIPTEVISLTIRRVHADDTETSLVYKGIVRATGFTLNGAEAELVVAPASSGTDKTMPVYRFSATCNHVLYSNLCGLNKNDYKHTGNVNSMAGKVANVAGANGESDGYYNGGYMQTDLGFRLILDHTGNNLTLAYPFPSTVVNNNADIYAGCAHDDATCSGSKFNNFANYGGFKWMPTRNPFDEGI